MKRLARTIAGGICLLGGRLWAQEPTANPQPLDAILAAPRPPETVEVAEREAEPKSEWETDRDSFTPSTKTAGRGTLILESAYTFEDNRHRPETHSFPEFLARYGLTERIELRIGWNYEVGGASSGASSGGGDAELFGAGLERESNLNLGLKLGISKQDQWIPDSILILTALTPTSGEETATQFVGTYAAGWEFPNRWRLDSGLRFSADSDHGHRFEEWAPSVVLKVPIGEKWDAHIEYFGIFGIDKESDSVIQYISPGLHYLLTENMEVGFRLGWGLNDQSARFFSNAGVGLHF